MESVAEKKSSGSSTMLGPGFRFHPTDEELVRYYLKRKICGKAFRLDAISEVDVYKSEPWDLPCMSKLQTRDQEWYFFSALDKKYGNKARTNRATEKGYWKTTGKDRPVYHYKQIVGMKKTLVYHRGRAPHGERSNWVMHEYRLADLELERVGIVQDAFVLCRIFQKSGSGPKNGEQYGAPFVEEEWEDDELVLVPQEETSVVVDFGDDDFLDGSDLQQILHSNIPSDASPLMLNFQSPNGNSIGETVTLRDDTQNPLICSGQQKFDEDADKNFHDLPAPYNTEVKPSSHEYIGESSKSGNFEDLDFFLDETFLDAIDNLHGEEGFIEANDLLNPIQADTSAFDMLDEYLTFVDAYENSPYFTYDPASIPGSKDVISNGVLLPHKDFILGTEEASLPSGELINNLSNKADVPFDKQELAKGQSDTFIKKASQILGKISAPPAFAAEFPSKDAVIRLNSVARSSSSVHINSGINQTRNSNLGGKNENFHLVLSFSLARGDDGSASLVSRVSLLPGKIESTMFRGWFCFMFLWVLILSVSLKVGTYIYAD